MNRAAMYIACACWAAIVAGPPWAKIVGLAIGGPAAIAATPR